jgi:septum formation protein
LSLKELFPGDWILGADQLVDFGGESLGKTPNFEKARAQLQRLQGRFHELVTSYCLIGPQTELTHTDRTRLHMRPLSGKQIESYLRQDEPYDCAGSYKLEKAGISLFEKIESQDFSAIQGLPLIAFSRDWLKISGTLPFETSAKESI